MKKLQALPSVVAFDDRETPLVDLLDHEKEALKATMAQRLSKKLSSCEEVFRNEHQAIAD